MAHRPTKKLGDLENSFHLMFEQHVMDLEAVWLIATYVEFVWIEKLKRNRTVKIEHIIGNSKLR
jgi:hypothetical protein